MRGIGGVLALMVLVPLLIVLTVAGGLVERGVSFVRGKLPA